MTYKNLWETKIGEKWTFINDIEKLKQIILENNIYIPTINLKNQYNINEKATNTFERVCQSKKTI